MTTLPVVANLSAAQGSQWTSPFVLQNMDGTPLNITGKTFEFAIRRTVTDTGTPLVLVSSDTTTASGTITVDVPTATVTVLLTPAATGSLVHGGGDYALWMNPGLTDATAMSVGVFFCSRVVAP